MTQGDNSFTFYSLSPSLSELTQRIVELSKETSAACTDAMRCDATRCLSLLGLIRLSPGWGMRVQVVVVVVVSVVGNWQMQSRSASAAGWPGQGLRLQLPWVLGAGRRRGVSVEAGGDDFHKLARLANAATKLKMLRHAQCAHHPLPLPFPSPQ